MGREVGGGMLITLDGSDGLVMHSTDGLLPSFSVSMPKCPFSPPILDWRIPALGFKNTLLPEERGEAKTHKCPIIPRFEQSLKGTFILQEDEWRRERDSNPRCPLRQSGFQDRLFQPLTHPSAWPV